ncbi:hypothetical protein ACPF04_06260 [Campylobacter sp. MOP51]|uniref:hypothetical protein n=1 Tax=Campylobacter canis TaxID=3378588 RepID=UPI003C4996F7
MLHKIILLSLISTFALSNQDFNPFDSNQSDVIEIEATEAVKDQSATIESYKAQQRKNEDEILQVIKNSKTKSFEEILPEGILEGYKKEPDTSSLKKPPIQVSKPEVEAPQNTQIDPIPQNHQDSLHSSPKSQELPAPILHKVDGIKYYKDLEPYSIFNHDQAEFSKIVAELKLPDITLQNLKNRYDSINAVVLNAIAYDYAEKNAPVAEGFYREFSKFKMSYVHQKLRYADFMIRTGRPQAALDLLSETPCYAHIKYSKICYYYVGLSQYLLTGNNRNSALNSARSHIKKAQEIWGR